MISKTPVFLKNKTELIHKQFKNIYKLDNVNLDPKSNKWNPGKFWLKDIDKSKKAYTGKLTSDDVLKADISCISYLSENQRPETHQNYSYDSENSTKKVAVYYNRGRAIVGFRGTVITSSRDLYSDVYIALNEMSKNKYFKKAFSQFMKITKIHSNKKIEITGHSLGGAISLFINSIPELDAVINKNTVFNPGITIAPMNAHIIEDYARNKKNRFIIKYGDPVSNGIIKFKPKNMVLVIKPIHKNLLKSHSLGLFIGDDMKLYLEELVTSGRKTSKQSRKSNQTKSRKKTIKKNTNYTDILIKLEKIKAQKFR
jgi:hypothetical protein